MIMSRNLEISSAIRRRIYSVALLPFILVGVRIVQFV